MRRSRKLSLRQKKFYNFLQEQERSHRACSKKEILDATGWKASTFDSYMSKGHFSSFLSESDEGKFSISGVLCLTEEEFLQEISQVQVIREFGAWCESELAQALIKKSRDNMILALELFNRPTVENRLDAFVILFTTAWEQLLKAMIIESENEDAIYKPSKPGKLRTTISFKECLDRIELGSAPIKRNLERIQDLRNRAIHLLMPELHGFLSRIFQAGIFNYLKAFKDFTYVSFLPEHSIGMLTLMGQPRMPTMLQLSANYGTILGKEILSLCRQLEDEMQQIDDLSFSIPVEYRLVFSKEVTGGEIEVSRSDDARFGTTMVRIPTEPEQSHPFLTMDAVKAINNRLQKDLSQEEFSNILYKVHGNRVKFTSHDFQAIIFKEGWKKTSKSQYHYCSIRPKTHRYSEEAINFIVRKICIDKNYLQRAQDSYTYYLKNTSE